jgi:predicted DNA-binding transcriptional regulator AlpA
MKDYATRDVAKKLGLSLISLKRYIAAKKIPVPPLIKLGNVSARLWSDKDVEQVREILPKIQNGRKTRHKKPKKQPKMAKL